MREIDTIVVHCSATTNEWYSDQSIRAKRDEIRRWHMSRNFDDIGYHFLIDRDGTTITGRHVSVVGAHAKGHNAKSIGICLIGGYGCEKNDSFADHFTVAQNRVLREMIHEIKQTHGIKKVIGHHEVANRECPGFNVAGWLAGKPPLPARNNVIQSSTVRASSFSLAGVLASAGSVFPVFNQLDENIQLIILVSGVVITISLIWILKERVQAWAKGWK